MSEKDVPDDYDETAAHIAGIIADGKARRLMARDIAEAILDGAEVYTRRQVADLQTSEAELAPLRERAEKAEDRSRNLSGELVGEIAGTRFAVERAQRETALERRRAEKAEARLERIRSVLDTPD